MMGRGEQVALISKWLTKNPQESLTSLARRAGLATTTLTRWMNNPSHPNQMLKADTFDQILIAIERLQLEAKHLYSDAHKKLELEESYAGGIESVEGHQEFIQSQKPSPVYSIPRPQYSKADPLGQSIQAYRPLSSHQLQNSQGRHIWLHIESNSMDPLIPQDSFVVVELNKGIEAGPGVYLISLDGLVDLRRLEIDFDEVVISADRPGFSEHRVAKTDTGRLHILGKAVSMTIETLL